MPRRESPDERLRTYRAKRDFSITAEPEGTTPPAAASGWRYVVQRHRARALHYDVRLEAGGVLASWAVPKGPTLDPAVRRLAVHVEDHPLDYYDFEGVIAAGEYGGGDVIVWDWGTWELVEGDDPLAAIAAGDVHLALDGAKLRGRFALVRRGSDRRDREQWLLIKKRDDDAVAGWDPEEHPRSVKSGRTNDEVLAAPAASWSGSANWAAATADELAALDELGESGTWSLGGHELHLTNLDTVLLRGRGRGGRPITTRDLVRHHAAMAPVMLPYLADRPLRVRRAPGTAGTARSSTLPARMPAWVRRWRHDETGSPTEHVVADSAAALAWLANWGAVEVSPSASTVDDPQRPTWAVFDIDPGPGGDVRAALALARLHRTALDYVGLEGRPILTGSRGIQIWVPIARAGADEVRRWVATIARAVDDTVPDLARHDETTPHDPLLVAPFGARLAPGAPVAVPITWDELDDDVRPDRWTIRDVAERVQRDGDPLAPLIGRAQRLPSL